MSSSASAARLNLEHLKKQARALLREGLRGDTVATGRFTSHGITAKQPKLADALHVIAREHSFVTWPAFKLHLQIDSEDPVEALIAAIKADDAALVRGVMERNPSLKGVLDLPLPKYGFDEPAILAAVHKQNRAMIDALLEAGADINARSRWWAGGFGVLDFAQADLAAYLIARGATVDIHAAARLGMIARVRELLLADPALVHARGGDGQLPLHFAATVEIAASLLDAGAEIEARDIDHESTALQYMVSTQPWRHEVARYLVERGAQADLLAASALGDMALVERIVNDDPDTVRITVSERSFPKRDPRAGGSIYIYGFGLSNSPHAIAHQFGHIKVFRLLMQRSAPWLRLVQAAEIHDEVLVRETLQRHPALFEMLTERAARRSVGVAVRNNTRAMELLLQSGWPAGAALDNHQTALHYAAFHGNLAMVTALLAHKAPVNVFEDEHGGSPLAWALHGSLHGWHRGTGDYAGVARALLNAGAKIPQPERPLEATEDVLAVLREAAT